MSRICMLAVLVVGFGIPLILMMFAYINISVTLWKSLSTAKQLRGAGKM